MIDIVCLGEVLIDMFPAEVGRPLVEVSAFRPKPGGAPANVAVAVHPAEWAVWAVWAAWAAWAV